MVFVLRLISYMWWPELLSAMYSWKVISIFFIPAEKRWVLTGSIVLRGSEVIVGHFLFANSKLELVTVVQAEAAAGVLVGKLGWRKMCFLQWPQWQYWSCEWESVLPNIRHKTTMVKDNGEKITWKVWILRCFQVRKMHMRCQLCSARRYFTELWISTLEDLLLVIRAAQRANVLQSQGKLFKRFKTGMVK